MRTLAAVLLLSVGTQPAPAAPLSYYLPAETDYDPAVPKPASVLGYEVGDWHVRHDQLTAYMKTLAGHCDRIRLEIMGHTHEQRELPLLTISSPANLARLETLRTEHLKLADPSRATGVPLKDQPVVLYLGYSVHGDESSGGNAALVAAYHLAAARGPAIDKLLDHAVILLDPCLNPDGFNRFAQWANSHRGRHPIADDPHREHHAAWPAGRGNHYWFDLNRDWLLLQHPESRARMRIFHHWKPNVVCDFHEMSSRSTFFFQPGVPERRNPLTPETNVRLTETIAGYHARALDAIGSLYYTEERFDDFYYGKGSTYPDVNGGIGILFEQASTRGHQRENDDGTFDFPFTIRNQFRTTLSTLQAVSDHRVALQNHQQTFFREALEEGRKDPNAAWVFGDAHDAAGTWQLLDLLLRHDIEVHALEREVTVVDKTFSPGQAWVVPLAQPQYRLIRTLFERQTEFPDNIFYDVSAWTFPLAMNLPATPLKQAARRALGARITDAPFPAVLPPPDGKPYAYAFEWNGRFAPRALNRLLQHDLRARVATKPFAATTPDGQVAYERGAIVIPLGSQKPEALLALPAILQTIAREDGVHVRPLTSGLTPGGIDLGSPSLRPLKKPVPMILVGNGVRAYEAGEAWHALDRRFEVPVALVDKDQFGSTDLNRYTHLILMDGSYSDISSNQVAGIQRWIRSGGVLVAVKSAVPWAVDRKLARGEFIKDKPDPDDKKDAPRKDKPDAEEKESEKTKRLDYGDHEKIEDAKQLSGAFFLADLDVTHPLGYGFPNRELPLFRNSRIFLKPSKNPYGTVAQYTAEPLLSGYVHPEELDKLKSTAAVVAEKQGEGAVILLVDNPNFRAYTHGPQRLFLNAIFFGSALEKTKE